MSISQEQIQEFEAEYKNSLFEPINNLSSDHISFIDAVNQCLNLNIDLPNISITFNNKIVEFSRIFKEHGISLFSHPFEEYGPLKTDFIAPSTLGSSIISDMSNYIIDASNTLGNCYRKALAPQARQNRNSQSLQISSPLRRLFAKIQEFFHPINPQEELNKTRALVKSYFSDFIEIDNQLFDYNLRDHIIPSLVNYLHGGGFNYDTAIGILTEEVIPDLEKLGLGDLIPQLKDALAKKFKEKPTPSRDLTSKQVANIRRTTKEVSSQHSPDSNPYSEKPSEPVANPFEHFEE